MQLSVAMCTCNGEQYVQAQLQSIVTQAIPVDEIVVCDDCSSDNTFQLVQAFASHYPSIRWQLYQNSVQLGVILNFRQSISLCSGDLIFLSDQDDIWLPHKTQAIRDFFLNHPDKDVVFTDADIIDAEGNIFSTRSLLHVVGFFPQRLFFDHGLEYEVFNSSNKATGATMALRRCFLPFLFERLRTDTDSLHDDQIAAYAIANHSLGYLLDSCIQYRLHDHNQAGLNMHQLSDSVYRRHACAPLSVRSIFDNPLFGDHHAFLRFRHHRGQTFFGRCSLLFYLPRYFRCYRSAALYFLWTDLTYGLIFHLFHHDT